MNNGGIKTDHKLRLWRANLTQLPKFVTLSTGDIPINMKDWIQQDAIWTALIYSHSGVLTINNVSHPYEPGMIAIVPPGARAGHSRSGYASDTESLYLNFDLDTQGPHVVALPAIHKLKDFRGRKDRLVQAMEYLPQGVISGKVAIWDLLWSIALPRQNLRRYEQLYAAEEWIGQNLSRQFDLSELCEALDLSSATLLRMIKAEHSMSTVAFIRFQRAQHAKHLLANTNDPIKQVAAAIGIQDAQQFNKLIRAYTGYSPKGFREQTQGKR